MSRTRSNTQEKLTGVISWHTFERKIIKIKALQVLMYSSKVHAYIANLAELPTFKLYKWHIIHPALKRTTLREY